MTDDRVKKLYTRAQGSAIRVGCCAYSYRDLLTNASAGMSLERFIDTAAEIGCEGVELTAYYFARPITSGYLHQIRRRCFLSGLDITGTAVGNTFALPPGPDRDAQLNLVRHWLDLSADLGAPCLRVFAGAPPSGVSMKQGRRWVIECLLECLDFAEERGVMLALENHGGVVQRPDGILEIIRRIRSPWLGVKLDTGNFDSDSPYEDLARCMDYTVSVHVKTEVRRSGVLEPVDYGHLVSLLTAHGYRGYINLEYEGREIASKAVPMAIAAMRNATRSAERQGRVDSSGGSCA